jgi:hypothetical protein
MIAEKFLGPAADLVDLAVIFKDFLHCAAVTEPIKVRAPEVFAALADRPTTGTGFADKRMIMVLAVVAPARAEADRSETGTAHQEVEEVVATRLENSKGGEGVGGIGRLHENVAHAESRPVGFEETGHGFVVAGETGVAGDCNFEGVEGGREVWRPSSSGNRLAVVAAFEVSQRLDVRLKPRNELVVIGAETDERVETDTARGQGPIVKEVELGCCWTVTILSEVVTDPLHSRFEKVALLRVERNAVALKDLTNAPEVEEDGAFVGAPEKSVVDDILAADGANGFGVAFGKESVPFGLKNAHHGGINGGCIAGSERHDVEAVLLQIRCKKSELLAVCGVDGDLVEAGAAVETDEPKLTVGIAEVIQ